MRNKYIIGNWKLNKDPYEIVKFFNAFNKDLKKNKKLYSSKNIVYGFAPTFIGISQVSKLIKGKTLLIAQDACALGNGSYTGQVSCSQLADYGVTHVIIGHSETRKYLGCTDKIVNAKAKAILAAKMVPIICIGESLVQYNKKQTKDVLYKQIKTIFAGINKKDAAKCIIAYEPLWAIGSGKTPTTKEINTLCKFFRMVLEQLYDSKTALTIPLLYGGSVNENNALSIVSLSQVDGSLIGGVSLHPDKFMKILKDVQKWKK